MISTVHQIIRFDTITLFVELRKGRIYADKPSTLEHLKTNIHQVMAEIPANVLKNGRKLPQSINAYNTSRSGHL